MEFLCSPQWPPAPTLSWNAGQRPWFRLQHCCDSSINLLPERPQQQHHHAWIILECYFHGRVDWKSVQYASASHLFLQWLWGLWSGSLYLTSPSSPSIVARRNGAFQQGLAQIFDASSLTWQSYHKRAWQAGTAFASLNSKKEHLSHNYDRA